MLLLSQGSLSLLVVHGSLLEVLSLVLVEHRSGKYGRRKTGIPLRSTLLLRSRCLSLLTTLSSGTGSSLLLGLAGGLGLGSLGTVVLADGLENGGLLLGLDDCDGVGESLLGTGLALGVRAAHDLDLDSENTLAEQDVTGGAVDEVLGGLTAVDHEAVGELHGLGTGGAQLSGNDNLAALGAGLHDEAEDTVAGAADGETVEELVAEGLALGDSGETAVLDLGGVEGDGVLGELEALLDQAGELADAAALLAEDLLCVGGADDDVGDGRGDADLDARVALLGQLALEELVQLGVEDAISDELSPLGAAMYVSLYSKLLISTTIPSLIVLHAPCNRRYVFLSSHLSFLDQVSRCSMSPNCSPLFHASIVIRMRRFLLTSGCLEQPY